MTDSAIWKNLDAELAHWRDGGIRLWLRDDDAIAASPALDRLAELGEGFGLPVLLAVIPMLVEPSLAAALEVAPSLLPCQHGCWHRNHAPIGGKKAEFGPQRANEAIREEIALARRVLAERLGTNPLPVFVPPWNRIDPRLAALLPELGFSGLSCFRGFALGAAGGPILVNTDLDVMDWHGGRVGRPLEALVSEFCSQLALRRAAGSTSTTFGLLLHHRDHDETAWTALAAILTRLCPHPSVVPTDPKALFSASPPAS